MFTDSKDQIKPCGHHYWDDCKCAEVATMPLEEQVHYLHERNEKLKAQFEIECDLREKEARRMADYVTTIRVLVELSAHHWL